MLVPIDNFSRSVGLKSIICARFIVLTILVVSCYGGREFPLFIVRKFLFIVGFSVGNYVSNSRKNASPSGHAAHAAELMPFPRFWKILLGHNLTVMVSECRVRQDLAWVRSERSTHDGGVLGVGYGVEAMEVLDGSAQG